MMNVETQKLRELLQEFSGYNMDILAIHKLNDLDVLVTQRVWNGIHCPFKHFIADIKSTQERLSKFV